MSKAVQVLPGTEFAWPTLKQTTCAEQVQTCTAFMCRGQVLRTAGDGRSAVRKQDIFQALKVLEKQRLKVLPPHSEPCVSCTRVIVMNTDHDFLSRNRCT